MNINFMRYHKQAGYISLLLVLLSILSLSISGLNFGLSFTGGVQFEVEFKEPIATNYLRSKLVEQKIHDPVVVLFGSEKHISIKSQQAIKVREMNTHLDKIVGPGNYQIEQAEQIGAQIGEELREDGGLGMLVALIAVMGYVATRYQYKFALGSVLALLHDVILVLGFFSITQLTFDITVLAGILAIIGYSINDTIVVFDRIRENFRSLRQSVPVKVVNASVNQIVIRTLITSLTTLIVLIILSVFGGEALFNFALALIVGVIVGTYSSIYVASNTILLMNIKRDELIPPEDDNEHKVQL